MRSISFLVTYVKEIRMCCQQRIWKQWKDETFLPYFNAFRFWLSADVLVPLLVSLKEQLLKITYSHPILRVPSLVFSSPFHTKSEIHRWSLSLLLLQSSILHCWPKYIMAEHELCHLTFSFCNNTNSFFPIFVCISFLRAGCSRSLSIWHPF